MKQSNQHSLIIVTFGLLLISLSFWQCSTPKETKPLAIGDLFSDHMVLQQQDEVTFWGTYTANEKITVEGSWGANATTNSDENGKWQLFLSTPEAGGPFTVSISVKDTAITLNDVLIGEVWIASGQSNMEMPLEGYLPNEPIDNNEEEIAAADYSTIRFFTVPRAISIEPLTSYKGEWLLTNPENARNFSATAYFFARKLYKELNVPIGIIESNWGGTPAEAWTSKERLLEMGEFEEQLTALESIDRDEIDAFLAKFPTVMPPSSIEGWATLDLQDANYKEKDYDDSEWLTGNLPADIGAIFENGDKKDGAFWFRKKVIIDDISTDYTLHIDQGVDDADITYVNGTKVGSMVCWNCPRTYTVPKSVLVKGANTIAIRMIDTGGAGSLKGNMYLKNNKDTNIDLSGEWRCANIAELSSVSGKRMFHLYHTNSEEMKNRPNSLDYAAIDSYTPSALYNAMINPIAPYSAKGVIWYQGESNVGRAEQYNNIFIGMIENWRERWGKDLSFYFVQIAPFTYGNELSPALRDAQRKSLSLNNTGMAVTLDIGDAKSIHPGNKQDVGKRLALWALANNYEKEIVPSGPLYKSHKTDNDKIIIEFDYSGSGLVAKNGQLLEFEIAGRDGNFVPATAKIVGDQVEVFSNSVDDPFMVRYAWRDNSEASLFNEEGLPASSFSTE